MSFGIQLSNGSGERIISDSAYNYAYIGQASLVSTATTAGGFDSIRSCLLCTYQIVSSTPPMPFIEGPFGNTYAAVSLRSLGGSTWEIVVVAFPRLAPAVHCFARVPPGSALANPNDFSIAVFDANGNVAFDGNKKALDHLYFTQIGTPSCTDDGSTNRLCAGSTSTFLGAMPARPAFFFQSQGRASLRRSADADVKRFLHMVALSAGGTATVTWNCCYFGGIQGSWPDFQIGVAPTTIIVLDAARFS